LFESDLIAVGMSEETDERLAKSGGDLFHELLRVYSVAEVDDYFKNGQWKDELMRTDLQLIEKHRREAGAPEPPDLAEVKLPPMPKAATFVRPGIASFGAASSGAATPSLGSAVAELRLIALFVAKWKLDATRTKTILAKLLPTRRRHVIASFKTENTGDEATEALEEWIKECDEKNSWPATAVVSPALATGVKRPFSAVTPSLGFDPSKRLATASTSVSYRPAVAVPARIVSPRPSPAAQAVAARLAIRPRAPTPIRPVISYRPVAKPVVRPAWGGATVRPVARTITPVRPAWGGVTVRPVVSAYRPAVRPTRPW